MLEHSRVITREVRIQQPFQVFQAVHLLLKLEMRTSARTPLVYSIKASRLIMEYLSFFLVHLPQIILHLLICNIFVKKVPMEKNFYLSFR